MFTRAIRSKREVKNLLATDGRGGKAMRIGEKHHVGWCFPTLPLPPGNDDVMSPVDCCDLPCISDLDRSVEDDSAMEESICDSDDEDDRELFAYVRQIHEDLNDEDINDTHDNHEVLIENVRELILAPEEEDVDHVSLEEEECDDMLEDEEEEEIFTKKHTYFDLDANSMKIVSFPDLKEKLENNVCCRICATKKRIGTVTVEQRTFKLATVFYFSCKYGHDFTLAPERINEKKIDSSDNFKINFCFILAMQILGKGLRTMSMFLGLLGIRISEGNYKVWKKIQDKIGVSEQKIAEQCCAENLQKEVEATIASGILPLEDGCVPLTCSDDTGWQGNGSCMTYNSQSGQTMLCGARTKKVVAYKFFSKLCRTCHDHSKRKKENESVPLPSHRCPKKWTESSKAMEPNGILDCAITVWNSGIASMDVFLSDDDSLLHCVLKHPIPIQILKDIIKSWPVDKHGKTLSALEDYRQK